jgi:hypothetical protein
MRMSEPGHSTLGLYTQSSVSRSSDWTVSCGVVADQTGISRSQRKTEHAERLP